MAAYIGYLLVYVCCTVRQWTVLGNVSVCCTVRQWTELGDVSVCCTVRQWTELLNVCMLHCSAVD